MIKPIVSLVCRWLNRIGDSASLYQTDQRFRGSSDWRRLVALGAMLICVSMNTFSDIYFFNGLAVQFGVEAIFSGLLILAVISQMKQGLRADCILVAAARIAAGLLLLKKPYLIAASSFGAFCALVTLGGLAVIWMGAKFRDRGEYSWLTAAGMTSVVCVIGFIGDRFSSRSLLPGVLLATDTLLLGVALVGLGLALKKR